MGEDGWCVAIGIEGDEDEADVGANVRRQCCFDAFHVVDEDGTGIGAGAEEHGDDVGAAVKGEEFDGAGGVVGPGGIEMEEGVVG